MGHEVISPSLCSGPIFPACPGEGVRASARLGKRVFFSILCLFGVCRMGVAVVVTPPGKRLDDGKSVEQGGFERKSLKKGVFEVVGAVGPGTGSLVVNHKNFNRRNE
jgi:hypothetical protein